MTATNINICPDGELEARAQSVLANLGLDMATAINMFLTQVVDKETLPFEMKADNFDATLHDGGWKPDPPKTPKPNCLRGKIWMADDFDAPMEIQEHTEPVKKIPQLGCMEGKIWMADDFDAPMEEFEEYM